MRHGRYLLIQRWWLGLCLGLAVLLSGCGGAGTKYNEFMPTRLVVLGDEISYVGCAVNPETGLCEGTHETLDRFNLNYNTAPVANSGVPFYNNWVTVLAANYRLGVDKIIESTYTDPSLTSGTEAEKRRLTRKGAAAPVVRAQADRVPAYQTGDLLIIAGGAHDVLCVVRNTDVSNCSSTTVRPGIDPLLMISQANASSLGNAKGVRIVAAAHAYQQLALDMIGRGHRNVFVVPVYDFSSSPDLGSFCTGCSAEDLKTAINLFNIALRAFVDSKGDPLTFSPGEPRILLTSGYSATDSLYVNIAVPKAGTNLVAAGAIMGYQISPSICGPQTSFDFVRANCSWNGLYVTTNAVTPLLHGVPYADDVTGDNRPVFLTNLGRYAYSADIYLSPGATFSMGSIFYNFMRGFQGW
ncbi:MAG: hypothetical protein QM527_10485 [Alphaproteobacteria bacterium]|nr:hypothetical protein [Alphaproteobacteria bacterium]